MVTGSRMRNEQKRVQRTLEQGLQRAIDGVAWRTPARLCGHLRP